ncbi:hypothetical protein J7354_15880 [Sulfitobacter sp. R18_2]|uniref:DUF6270 domain-containing protein n=1 Tax=Sulfitobacter sp. R18_2 TaxID=2821105 RepID=UPI001ADAF7E6|nr:DUF6270 domain-containing protein [Sulfitobacter sp. R18_2]MBO9440136.1 hypothetical protein [Sulfitobacter sp. R18_2]
MLMALSQTPVHILGSCASRDAFEFDFSEEFKVVDYTARTSLASLACLPKLVPSVLSEIDSPFQKRMVQRDMSKSFWSAVESYESGLIIVDLIDDRFRLNLFPNGAAHTVSAEYAKARHAWPKGKFRTLGRETNEYLTLWLRGVNQLQKKLNSHGNLQLLVNCVYYTATNNNSIDDMSNIDGMNEYLSRAYGFLRQAFGESAMLTYPKEALESDMNHKWGLAPFHYSTKTYMHLINSLSSRVG